MAYLYVNTDGVTRPYSTINDAYATASGGDTLILDPGVYTETLTMSDGKAVNIRGNTTTPENDDVIITANALPLRLGVQTSSANVYIEGVTLRGTAPGNYSGVFYDYAQTSSKYVNLTFNRCRFLMYGNSNNYAAIMFNNAYYDALLFDHCEWDLTTSNTKNEYHTGNRGRMNSWNVLACVYEGTYQNYAGAGDPDINNYVTAPSEGYGPQYSSDWYIPLEYPPVGYFDGYVMEEGSPAQRKVYLYNRANGTLVNQTTSNASGYYYMETTSSGMHHIVALDAPADPLYNDLIIGSAYPTPL